jgi:hypothetical protein
METLSTLASRSSSEYVIQLEVSLLNPINLCFVEPGFRFDSNFSKYCIFKNVEIYG